MHLRQVNALRTTAIGVWAMAQRRDGGKAGYTLEFDRKELKAIIRTHDQKSCDGISLNMHE